MSNKLIVTEYYCSEIERVLLLNVSYTKGWCVFLCVFTFLKEKVQVLGFTV